MKILFKSKLMQTKEETRRKQHPEEELPESFFRDLMDDQLGRGYLNHMPPADQWMLEKEGLRGNFGWLRFNRLPIKPGKEDENTLLDSWQSVLSACHTMNLKLAFVLMRRGGKTEIYLGACTKEEDAVQARDQLGQCMSIHMPGAELQPPDEYAMLEETLENYTHSGIVTGIPSLRSENSGVTLQTLDKLARGIRIDNQEKSYALVILADPAEDREIVDLQQTFLELKSEIHQFVGYSEQVGMGTHEGQHNSLGGGVELGYVMEALALALLVTGNPLGAAGAIVFSKVSANISKGKNRGFNTSNSVTREYKDFIAKYCEDLIDRNVTRLERGRNLGFWQTGIYVLSEDNVTTDSVLGVLRSVYSGKESYVEPIRVFNAGSCEGVSNHVSRLQLLPLPGDAAEKQAIGKELGLAGGNWHILGRMYESFTTALTTEELSIASSLPRREVPGLRMVKNNVPFANNAPSFEKWAIPMGNLVDLGVPQTTRYGIDHNALVRHILVAGSTGSGKTTTCKKIIRGVRSKNIPVLIIEPAKDDYVRWAIEENKHLPEDQQYLILMPGASKVEGVKPRNLNLNLFQPAAWKDTPVNLVQHAEWASTLLNACLPSEEVIPIIIEESVHRCMETAAEESGADLTEIENPQLEMYPTLNELIRAGEEVIDRKTYEKKTKENFREILQTRFRYLGRGTRGRILDCPLSTDFEMLFDRPVVLNLSRLAGTKDKSLITSLVLLALQEYRASRYEYDEEFRQHCQNNELMHLLVLEEAHNVLTKPSPMSTGSGNPQQAAADLFSTMLSEIRSYGQGMMIVDQVPTRLIEDALKNTNYKIAHRMTAPDDIQAMAAAMVLRPDQAEIIPSLEIGNAIICGDMDDAASWIKIDRKK